MLGVVHLDLSSSVHGPGRLSHLLGLEHDFDQTKNWDDVEIWAFFNWQNKAPVFFLEVWAGWWYRWRSFLRMKNREKTRCSGCYYFKFDHKIYHFVSYFSPQMKDHPGISQKTFQNDLGGSQQKRFHFWVLQNVAVISARFVRCDLPLFAFHFATSGPTVSARTVARLEAPSVGVGWNDHQMDETSGMEAFLMNDLVKIRSFYINIW